MTRGDRARRQGRRDPPPDAADAPRYLDLGFRFIGIGSDLTFVTDGARGVVSAVKG